MFCKHEFQKDFEDLVKDNMVNIKTCARNNLVIKVSRSFIAHCKACERRIFLVIKEKHQNNPRIYIIDLRLFVPKYMVNG